MPKFITLEQACEKLNISRWTAMRWLADGRLPGKKIGRKWLIPEQAVTAPPVRVHRGMPLQPSWLVNPIEGEELTRIVSAVGTALKRGGAPVLDEGLRKLVTGEEPPTPIFWRYLAKGIENILNPNQQLWIPTDADMNEIKHIMKSKTFTSLKQPPSLKSRNR